MKVSLQLSSPHECGYFDNRTASTLFLQPDESVNSGTYSHLLELGFRRSGRLIYKPHCKNCSACLPLRVNVKDFKPGRTQKRVLVKNRDIDHQLLYPRFNDQHYRLYKQYLASRHSGGGMEKHTRLDYFESMIVSEVNTVLIEFRLDEQLVAVAVTDVLDSGLSAVYTFFDTHLSEKRSLGNLAILRQIELARSMERKWVYLGYLIEDSTKMSYKSEYCPAQIFQNNKWVDITRIP